MGAKNILLVDGLGLAQSTNDLLPLLNDSMPSLALAVHPGERTPDMALSRVRYLQRLHVGLIGWAVDSEYGKLVKDRSRFEPTDYRNFYGCAATNPPLIVGAGRLLANLPNS